MGCVDSFVPLYGGRLEIAMEVFVVLDFLLNLIKNSVIKKKCY